MRPRIWAASTGVVLLLSFSFLSEISVNASVPTVPLWDSLGPHSIRNLGGTIARGLITAGKVQDLAVSAANPSVMIIANGVGPGNAGPRSTGGAFKTADGGNTWLSISRGLGDSAVDSVWVNQSSPNQVIVGTFSKGIYFSSTGGSTWTNVFTGSTGNFVQMGKTIYAASEVGVIDSVNLISWQSSMPSSVAVRVVAGGGGALYAGLDNGTVKAKLGSQSAWSTVMTHPGGTVWSIAVNASNPDRAFVVEWDNYQQNNVYVTHDGGQTWSQLSIPYAAQFVSIDASSGSTVYVGTGLNILVSHDAGNNFSVLPLSVDTRLVEALPSGLYVGSDQGLFRSNDGGHTFVGINGNLSNSLLTSISVNGQTIFPGTQDYSPVVSFDGGQSWQNLYGSSPPSGEDGEAVFNPGNPSYAYVYSIGGLQYSSDGAMTFSHVNNLGFDKLTYQGTNCIFGFDAATPSTVYVVAKPGIYVSRDWGASWSEEPWSFSQPSLIYIAPDNSQKIFVGDANGLHVSNNGGSTWMSSSLAGAASWPLGISVDPTNSSHVVLIMAYGPETGGGVLLSTDGGNIFNMVNSGVVSQPTGVFPSMWDVKFDPTGRLIALATGHGIFLSSNLGNTWINFQSNAVPTTFTGVYWSGGFLYVSSYGGGVLRMSADQIQGYFASVKTTTSTSTSTTSSSSMMSTTTTASTGSTSSSSAVSTQSTSAATTTTAISSSNIRSSSNTTASTTVTGSSSTTTTPPPSSSTMAYLSLGLVAVTAVAVVGFALSRRKKQVPSSSDFR